MMDNTRESMSAVVVVGLAGSGKSATGNTILGRDVFESRRFMQATTKRTTAEKRCDSANILVIDTPPLPDSNKVMPVVDLVKELRKCWDIAKQHGIGGLDAVLLTINANGRIDQESIDAINFLINLFGDDLKSHLIIVFTRADVLEKEETTLKDLVDDLPDNLTQLVKEIEGRVISLDNKTRDKDKKETKVIDLKGMISKIKGRRNYHPLTSNIIRNEQRAITSYNQACAHRDENVDDTFGRQRTNVTPLDKNVSTHKGDMLSLAVVGLAGSGKSATANTILGKAAFRSQRSFTFTTKHATADRRRDEVDLLVIDTPPLPDSREMMNTNEIASELSRCWDISRQYGINGLDAILLTVNANDRLTQEWIDGFEFLNQIVGQDLYKYLIVIFTREDQLAEEGINLDSLLSDSPDHLKSLLRKINNRVLAFDNKTTDMVVKKTKVDTVLRMMVRIKHETHNARLVTNVMENFEKANRSYMKSAAKREKELHRYDQPSKCCMS